MTQDERLAAKLIAEAKDHLLECRLACQRGNGARAAHRLGWVFDRLRSAEAILDWGERRTR